VHLRENQRQVVLWKMRITSDERRPFQLGLCEQYAIERIAVVQRQFFRCNNVIDRERQQLEAHSRHVVLQINWGLEFSNCPLNCDFSKCGYAHVNFIRTIGNGRGGGPRELIRGGQPP